MDCADGIPLSIVRFNRLTLVIGIGFALGLRAPWITTILFVLMAAAALFGSSGSPIYQLGMRLFRKRIASEGSEDPRLMRFNNSLAAIMLGIAQFGFALHVPEVGWAMSLLVAAAACLALAGFCVGCAVFYRFKLERYKLFGR